LERRPADSLPHRGEAVGKGDRFQASPQSVLLPNVQEDENRPPDFRNGMADDRQGRWAVRMDVQFHEWNCRRSSVCQIDQRVAARSLVSPLQSVEMADPGAFPKNAKKKASMPQVESYRLRGAEQWVAQSYLRMGNQPYAAQTSPACPSGPDGLPADLSSASSWVCHPPVSLYPAPFAPLAPFSV